MGRTQYALQTLCTTDAIEIAFGYADAMKMPGVVCGIKRHICLHWQPKTVKAKRFGLEIERTNTPFAHFTLFIEQRQETSNGNDRSDWADTIGRHTEQKADLNNMPRKNNQRTAGLNFGTKTL